MKEIVRIVIKGESGYCLADHTYKDKLTITRESIRYEYKPIIETEKNISRSWSYKTNSPKYQKVFDELTALLPEILNRVDMELVKDLKADR